jgi:sugar (pentulose or hexulose) kinase
MRDGGVEVTRFIATGGVSEAPHVTTAVAKALGVPVTIDPRPHRTAAGPPFLRAMGR